ncbi:MAG: DNA polymerase I [Bacteroidales bacterium]
MTPQLEKKLFLVDAYSLIFRAYYAFINNPRINSKGKNTSAIFGFTNSLNEILKKEKPSHIAVVFDPPGGSFRRQLYPEYKANRSATPEDIIFAVPYIKKIIEGFNIPVVEIPNYEADDAIGTLAKLAEKKGFRVYMVTPDKDYGQLVSDNIFIYKPGRKGGDVEILGKTEICQYYGIQQPEQVIDILALWGDTSDNVPGVPGIGELTAAKLVARFGSVEKLLANVSLLSGKQKENVIASRETVKLSRQLVTIPLDVPVEFDENAMQRKPLNKELLEGVFNELEFRTIAAQIFTAHQNIGNNLKEEIAAEGDELPPVNQPETTVTLKNINNTPHNYVLVEKEPEIDNLVSALLSQKEFCFDTETTGLDFHGSEVTGIAFSYQNNSAYYVNLPKEFDGAVKLVQKFKNVFENQDILKIGQNIKFDIQMLKKYNIDVKGPFFDTMLAHYLLSPEQKHNFNFLAEVYLNYKPVEIEELIGPKGKEQKNMRDVDPQLVKEYSGEDADITYQLKGIFKPELEKHGLLKLSEEIEMPLVPVLAEVEYQGVSLDLQSLGDYSVHLSDLIKQVEKEIYGFAGHEFNISSPKQLGDILFEEMKIIPNPVKTKTGQYSTSEQELDKLKDKHEIINKILEFRSYQKLLSTYVDALPKLVNPVTQKVHTSYNQAVTATGRLSSTNPNLQNIPVRTEEGREIRKAFVPSSADRVILSADYSQIELRLIAALSGDENMIQAFKNGEDIHTSTAARIFNLPLNEVSREMRARAKSANFGIIYGISSFGLAQNLRISRSEAKDLIDNYFKSYPKVKEYMSAQVALAREKEYVTTLFSRRRYLQDINSRNAIVRGVAERNAINAPIQGTAADIIKLAMINIFSALEKESLKSKMILQVHDELVFDAYINEIDQLKSIVKIGMENACHLSVPLLVEMGSGKNWLEAH